MKNFIKIIAGGLFSLVAATGCNKDVSLEPIFFQPTTFTTETQLDFQLAAVYGNFNVEQLYAQGLWGYFATGADEGFRTDAATGTSTQVLTESYRGTSGEATYSSFWRGCYKGIEQCNVILDGIKTINYTSQAKKNNIIGQALFMRAYYFYLLTSNFGDIVLKTTLTTDLVTNFALPKTPTKQVYEFILADMKRADTLVQSISTIGNTTVVSQSAVEAILARVCLSMAGHPVNDASKYKEALYWANQVIGSTKHTLNATPLAVYSTTYPTPTGLPAPPAYSNVFTNNMQNTVAFGPGNSEGIWDAAFLSKSNATGPYANTGFVVSQQLGSIMGITNPTTNNGFSNGSYRVFPKLYNLYGNGDLRRDWIASPYIFDANNNKYGYVTATVTPAVTTPVYSGKPAILSVFVNGAGGISSINVVDGGTGYTKLPTGISLSVPSTGSGATFKIDTLGGAIKAITVLTPGSGYVTPANRCVGKWRREYEKDLSGVTRINNNTSCNFPIIRYADVLLMAAEADLKANGTPTVGVEYYNQVRRRAYGYNPTSPQPGFDVLNFTMPDIMDERSRELCFEGQRRLDLLRWGNMAVVMQNLVADNNVNIATTALVTAANITANNFLSNPTKYSLFPIPASEIINDNVLTQNPGW